jgi:hypothetical protein
LGIEPGREIVIAEFRRRVQSRGRSSGGPARLRARCAAALAKALADSLELPAFNWHEALAAA